MEESLRGANLWEEVKTASLAPARPSLAASNSACARCPRAIAVKPRVLLMDEPCPAPGPNFNPSPSKISHARAAAGLHDRHRHPQHAASARVSQKTGFFNIDGTGKPGHLVEFDDTEKIFANPAKKETEDYVSGRFGHTAACLTSVLFPIYGANQRKSTIRRG